MKRYLYSAALAAGMALLFTACGRADLVLKGNVITMDPANPVAQAVAVKDGRVLLAGSLEQVQAVSGRRTRVVDYGKASIYPGFMEGHAHGALAAFRAAQADLFPISGKAGARMADYAEAMKRHIRENPGLPAYKGAGWIVCDCYPCAAMLDAVCPDVPMYLNSADGHSMWLNSAAMKACGIDSAYADRMGHNCVRVDADGNPTGFMSETAAIAVLKHINPSFEESRNGLLKWQEYAFAHGITATTEAALNLCGPNVIKAYETLQKEGKWKLRTYAVQVIDESVPDEKLDSALESVLNLHLTQRGEYFKVTGVKVFMDGVVEAHTAWLDDGYTDNPSDFGLHRCTDTARIARIVSYANSHDMNVHFHAIGDGAVRTAVEGIVAGQKAAGVSEPRNAVAHLQVVHPQDIVRMGQNHIIAVVAPLWVPTASPIYDYECKYIGERAKTQYPIKSFTDEGCVINFHSDYPISPVLSMPYSIYGAVERALMELGEGSRHNYPEHITRLQALEAVTTGVAYQWKEEDRLGSLSEGKIANMVVYDTDFLNDTLAAVDAASLLATYIDGEVVYQNK